MDQRQHRQQDRTGNRHKYAPPPRFWGDLGRDRTSWDNYREERKTAAGGHERSDSGPYLPSTPSRSRQEPPNGSALDNVSALAPSARQSQQDAGNGPQRPEEPEPVQTITEDPKRAQRAQYEPSAPTIRGPHRGRVKSLQGPDRETVAQHRANFRNFQTAGRPWGRVWRYSGRPKREPAPSPMGEGVSATRRKCRNTRTTRTLHPGSAHRTKRKQQKDGYALPADSAPAPTRHTSDRSRPALLV